MRRFHSPSSRWNSNIVRKRPRIPRTHSKAGTTCKEWRSQSRASRRTGRASTARNKRWRWSPQWLLVNPRWLNLSSSYWTSRSTLVPEETFPIPLKKIDVTRATYSNLDVLQDKLNDDHWHVDVNRSLSDSWKGITKLTLLKEKPPKGYMWSGREGEQKFKQLPDIISCGLAFGPLIRKRSKNGRTKNQSSIMLED